ncbi:MAG TPA: SDR family NAD(P)-dependent oxidoreductase [Thermoanaerobaculia bacterium]|nr:SDR family NAD(P)-dependent oxidoreductase [Thermoanaerobaculia bacterium]
MKPKGRRAVVTGASSGIGRATALALARQGAHLVIAARRVERLEEVASSCREIGAVCHSVPADVENADECAALIARATALLGGVDILVCSAGFALYDSVAEANRDEMRAMMNVNYFGALHVIQAVLPQMLERRLGAIVSISSVCGIMGFARMGGYCATKFALNGLTESLRNELLPMGITVSMVCPNTTATEFFEKAERGKQPEASRLILAMPPERVAAAVIRAIETGRYRIIVPFSALLYMRFKEIFPRTAHLMMRVTSSLLERRRER